MNATEAVRVERDGPILEVMLDRPKANAIDGPTSRRMGEVFAAFRDDPELRVADADRRPATASSPPAGT